MDYGCRLYLGRRSVVSTFFELFKMDTLMRLLKSLPLFSQNTSMFQTVRSGVNEKTVESLTVIQGG